MSTFYRIPDSAIRIRHIPNSIFFLESTLKATDLKRNFQAEHQYNYEISIYTHPINFLVTALAGRLFPPLEIALPQFCCATKSNPNRWSNHIRGSNVRIRGSNVSIRGSNVRPSLLLCTYGKESVNF